MDFIDDFKAILIEHYKPAEVGTITDLVTVVLQHYDVQPKQTGLVVYEQSDVDLVQKFFIAKVTQGLAERTLARYRECLMTVLPSINKHIKDITTNDIRAHLVRMKLRGCSERTMNNDRLVLSSFFGFLLKEGEITTNPVARIAKIKEPKKLKKPLTELQLETLKLKAGIREKAIIEFLYSTGCRVAEMVGLNLSDVDLDKGEAVVFGKGKKYRTVFLTSKCVLYLKNYLSTRTDNEPPLFVGQLKPHGRLNICSVGTLLRNLGRECGIEKVHPHRFRRTCATMALHRGMPIDQVRLMLGHESIETTTIYAEESMDVVKQSHAKYM